MNGGAGEAEPLHAWLAARRRLVDEALARWIPAPPQAPPLIAEAMTYSVRAGGKRLRPLLALATADAVGRMAQPPLDETAAQRLALPAACAIELIHTYSLVHDDLPAMDNDTMRRGQPTLHVVYGDGIAILAGDGLLTEAFALIAREPSAPDGDLTARKLRAVARLAEAAGAGGMVGGQTLDLQLTGQAGSPAGTSPPDLERLQDLHSRKTGALIRASAAIGAIMAGGEDETIDATDRFGAGLGLAFQIVDDILDVEGDAASLGKTAGKDAAAGKLTYPALVGVEASRRLARDAIARAEAALAGAAVPADRLRGIAAWVLERQR